MARLRLTRFAFASPNSSTVSFFDHSTWVTNARIFPDGIGSLVDSAGELFFFVKLIDDPFENADSPLEKWVLVSSWNPFTGVIDHLPRPPSITSSPSLVRVQPLEQDHRAGYIFRMVGLNHEGKKVMESYHRYPDSIRRGWDSIPCDHWTIQAVSAAGLHPPSIVFRQIDTGALVKFDAPENLNIQATLSQALLNCYDLSKLDDPHKYVFLLPVREEGLPTQYGLQVEWHPRRNLYQVRHSSPQIELYDPDACWTYVYGARTAAIVVQIIPRLESLEFELKIHLHLFGSSIWFCFEGFRDLAKFTTGDYSRALLCQTTAEVLLLNSRSVDGAGDGSRLQLEQRDEDYLHAWISDHTRSYRVIFQPFGVSGVTKSLHPATGKDSSSPS